MNLEAQVNGNYPAYPDDYTKGLTKNELIAAMAMQGLLSNPALAGYILTDSFEDGSTDRITRLAAFCAQELLSELQL